MRLLVLSVLCVALMVVDARFETLKPLRSQMGLVLTPFYWLADLPVRSQGPRLAHGRWSPRTRSSRPKRC